MLFNSTIFLFAFLPLTLALYFGCQHAFRSTSAGKILLLTASVMFYGFWNPWYVLLLLGSIVLNFALGRSIQAKGKHRKTILMAGLVANIGLLAYFKYRAFALENLNALLGWQIPVPSLVLPLALSFFTFQQIAYLVDCYRGRLSRFSFLDYSVVVSFFPHLIAGPIIQYRDVIPQFASSQNRSFQPAHFNQGLYLLSIGLAKKLLLADSLSYWAIKGFDDLPSVPFMHAWLASLSYTLQLYFDFSGYSDMAVGLALMFNIRLPLNFNSPYKALSIQDFWRRWHITLSQFLRDYLYLPLGGSHGSSWLTYRNVLIVFLVGGLWHGAGWNFLFWGLLHGLAMVVYLSWNRWGRPLPGWLAWFLTFQFVNLTWVFFRASTWADAMKMLRGMAGLSGFILPGFFSRFSSLLEPLHVNRFGNFFTPFYGTYLSYYTISLSMAVGLALALFAQNSSELSSRFAPRRRAALYTGFLIFSSLMVIEAQTHSSKFLYFNF